MKTILIVGATSAIAEETAKLFADQGHQLILWGRNRERIQSIQKNLEIRGAGAVHALAADLDDCEKHTDLLKKSLGKCEAIDVALIAHGVLPDQEEVQGSFSAMLPSLHTNFLSTISVLTVFGEYFEEQMNGVLACITSVAADRGRKSNYVYGAAKAGVSAFTDGLRGRLAASGAQVVNIKPGMVDTPMTAHLKKGALFASPQSVAKGIIRAIEKKKSTAYVPGYWRLIMFVIRCIPESIFKKVNL